MNDKILKTVVWALVGLLPLVPASLDDAQAMGKGRGRSQPNESKGRGKKQRQHEQLSERYGNKNPHETLEPSDFPHRATESTTEDPYKRTAEPTIPDPYGRTEEPTTADPYGRTSVFVTTPPPIEEFQNLSIHTKPKSLQTPHEEASVSTLHDDPSNRPGPSHLDTSISLESIIYDHDLPGTSHQFGQHQQMTKIIQKYREKTREFLGRNDHRNEKIQQLIQKEWQSTEQWTQWVAKERKISEEIWQYHREIRHSNQKIPQLETQFQELDKKRWELNRQNQKLDEQLQKLKEQHQKLGKGYQELNIQIHKKTEGILWSGKKDWDKGMQKLDKKNEGLIKESQEVWQRKQQLDRNIDKLRKQNHKLTEQDQQLMDTWSQMKGRSLQSDKKEQAEKLYKQKEQKWIREIKELHKEFEIIQRSHQELNEQRKELKKRD